MLSNQLSENVVFYEQNATEAEVLPYYYAEDRIVQPGFYLKLPQVYQNTVRYYFSTMGFLSLKFPYLVLKFQFAHVEFFHITIFFRRATSTFWSFSFNTRFIKN